MIRKPPKPKPKPSKPFPQSHIPTKKDEYLNQPSNLYLKHKNLLDSNIQMIRQLLGFKLLIAKLFVLPWRTKLSMLSR